LRSRLMRPRILHALIAGAAILSIIAGSADPAAAATASRVVRLTKNVQVTTSGGMPCRHPMQTNTVSFGVPLGGSGFGGHRAFFCTRGDQQLTVMLFDFSAWGGDHWSGAQHIVSVSFISPRTAPVQCTSPNAADGRMPTKQSELTGPVFTTFNTTWNQLVQRLSFGFTCPEIGNVWLTGELIEGWRAE
jgi:hypothetical protein